MLWNLSIGIIFVGITKDEIIDQEPWTCSIPFNNKGESVSRLDLTYTHVRKQVIDLI